MAKALNPGLNTATAPRPSLPIPRPSPLIPRPSPLAPRPSPIRSTPVRICPRVPAMASSRRARASGLPMRRLQPAAMSTMAPPTTTAPTSATRRKPGVSSRARSSHIHNSRNRTAPTAAQPRPAPRPMASNRRRTSVSVAERDSCFRMTLCIRYDAFSGSRNEGSQSNSTNVFTAQTERRENQPPVPLRAIAGYTHATPSGSPTE